MIKEILDKIQALGGDISTVKNISLQKDLEAITFNSVLYPKKRYSLDYQRRNRAYQWNREIYR